MNEKELRHNEELEIDLLRLLHALLNKSLLIGITAVLCAALLVVGTFFFVTPQYQSAAMFYVNNSLSLGEASLSISSADITASRGLVKSCIVILNTRETLNEVIDDSGVDVTYGQLKTMITAEAVDATEIFKVVVTSPDPEEAQKLAGSIAHILPKRISGIIEGSSAKIVDSAVVPTSPSSPSYVKNMVIGFLLGLVLSAAGVVLWAMMDMTIRSEDDLIENCSKPILTAVPDMEVRSEDGSITFAAAEAYKLLRTKLQYSFADENGCRVIGVSSAMIGEGKSLTAANLAYSISQLDKRVLLVDCDMRRSALAEKLPIRKTPGLSDFLSGQIQPDRLLQLCGIKDDEKAFHVISAGSVPPNPMELLSTNRMQKMLELLRQRYDYILLDLPPVGEVGDALAAAGLTDGMLIVVRQNYCNRIALNSAVRQFEFVNARILGIVFNGIREKRRWYGKHYYRRDDKQYQQAPPKKPAPAVRKNGKFS